MAMEQMAVYITCWLELMHKCSPGQMANVLRQYAVHEELFSSKAEQHTKYIGYLQCRQEMIKKYV